MSTPQWQNLPIPPGGDDWKVFSIDPREPQNAGLRASDADRSAASSLLNTAFADGRLDRDEYDQRLNQVMASRQLGELVPVLADIVAEQRRPAAAPPGPALTARGFLSRLPRWWIALALMFNAIWLMTCLGTGRLLYYWPMWPMFGTAIPIIMAMVAGGQRPGRPSGPGRPQLPPPGRDLR